MARMDEGGPVAARDLGLADQLEAVGLETAHEWAQPVDVDRQVVKPLAPPRQEALDEARRTCALDQLHLVACEQETQEDVHDDPPEQLRARHLTRQLAPQPGERRLNRATSD